MSLDLANLLPQIEEMGTNAAERLTSLQQILPKLKAQLEALAAQDPNRLQEKILAAGENWPGARLSDEPPYRTYTPGRTKGCLNVIAADGSQVLPDRHAAALFYLINIGAILIRYGTGKPPKTRQKGSLFYEDEDLVDESGGEIRPQVINARRDLLEMTALADLAEECAGDPTIALLDNGLLLWLALQSGERQTRRTEKLLHGYLQQLSRLREAGIPIAGFLDRPNHSNVVTLLHLASLDQEEILDCRQRTDPHRSIPDRHLFGALLPGGHRSALFVHNAALNTVFRHEGHEVYFFYLNPGQGDQIVRVEVPQWVASNSEWLALIHAGILEQCRLTQGYPYALVRAHELAIVTAGDRQSIHFMIQKTLIDQGILPRFSRKAETKQWLGGRRRHRV